MWRAATTYIWHKFRAQARYRAFLEPLHECLLETPESALRGMLPTSVTALMRHPIIDLFYYDEYAFQPSGGVSHFRKSFSYQRYCLDPSQPDPPLRRYVQSLIDIAHLNGQQPMLQFNRALLRAGWLAENFVCRTILLLRRPSDLWNSFISYENLYFPTVICMIIGQNNSDSALHAIACRHQMPCYVADHFAEEYSFYHELAMSRLESLYPLFFEFCVVANMSAASFSDLVVDMNEISTNGVARASIEDQFSRIGVDLDLSDCAVPVYTLSALEEKKRASIEDEILLALCKDRKLLTSSPLPGDLGIYWSSIFEKLSSA